MHLSQRGAIIPLLAGALLVGAFWYFGGKITEFLLTLINYILGFILPAVKLFFDAIAQLSAFIINTFILLNPFSHLTVAPILWEFFKNIAYVVLIFLSLYAGLQFILNKEDEARRLLIGILIVAFLINFTFVLAKEFFSFFWHLTKAVIQIVGEVSTKDNNIYQTDFGNTLYLSMALLIGDKAKEIGNQINEQISNINLTGEQIDMTKVVTDLAFNLFLLLMSFIGSVIMAMFAGIAVGKFFIISFLVGLLPLACIAYILPNQKRYFDQWWQTFFTWNINILILILLVSIGIFLFASTAGANQIINDIFMISDIQDSTKNQPTTGIGALISLLAPAFVYSSRILIIIIYYLIVTILALRLGGRFSKAGYDFTKWTWLKTGSLIAEGGKSLARKPLYGLGEKLNKIANTVAERGPTWALIAKRIRGTGERMQKPVKERSKEAIEAMWEVYKYKNLNEIAEAIKKLKGEDLYNFTRLVSRDKSPDEIFKIYSQSPELQNDIKARKIICQRVKCSFDDVARGDKRTAMQKLASSLDFNRVTLEDLERLLQIQEKERGELVQFLINNMTRGGKINFFSDPNNIKKIREWGLETILQSEENTIKKTPHYRVFNEIMDNILRQLIEAEREREQILEAYLQRYITGGLDVMSLTADRLRNELSEIMNNLNIQVDIKDVPSEELNKLISQLQSALQTRPVEKPSTSTIEKNEETNNNNQ
ncbi:MAG: hypothetical protein KatS3mg094_328 [Candidatus Parcubacteria bacterium]|nr:MAG: hypothetical protein KatS3mg094_328 [Candidatus Parcubacteria bacterium]